MDYETILQKVHGSAYDDLPRRAKDDYQRYVKKILEAAGLPEMEKRLQAAEQVCEAVIVVRDEFCFGCGGPGVVACEKCEINQALNALRKWEAVG